VEPERDRHQFAPAGFEQKYLGPRDTNSPITDSLLSGFSPLRLQGKAPPLPGAYATIPADAVESFPHFGGKGCAAIGVTPTDHDAPTPPPAGFNTLPSTLTKYN
jgi:phospholipase C